MDNPFLPPPNGGPAVNFVASGDAPRCVAAELLGPPAPSPPAEVL
jgi:hypothetical protein